MHREPFSQAPSRLTDVPRRAERVGNAIDDVVGGASEGVVFMHLSKYLDAGWFKDKIDFSSILPQRIRSEDIP